MTLYQRMRGCSLFGEMDASDVEALLRKSKVYEWNKGQRMLQENEPCLEFSIIIDGQAIVYKNLNTKLMEIRDLSRGDFYGDFSLSGIHQSPFEIFAKSNIEEVKVTVDDFYEWIQRKPTAGIQFFVNLMKEVQTINAQSLGIIARLHKDHQVPIGFPLFGNKPLSQEEARQKRIHLMQKKINDLKFKKSA